MIQKNIMKPYGKSGVFYLLPKGEKDHFHRKYRSTFSKKGQKNRRKGRTKRKLEVTQFTQPISNFQLPSLL